MASEDVLIGIGVDLGNSVSQLTKFNSGLDDTVNRAKSGANPVRGFFDGIVGKVAGVGLAVTGIGALAMGVGSLASGMVSGNAEFETYLTQFGVLLGSTEAAKQRLDELSKFGASTPFELPEIVKADKVLTSFGLSSEDTAKKFGVSGAQIRTTIGDIAAGTGTSFEELSLTFGKFASGATGEAIARFQELGIVTKEEMAGLGLEFSKSGQLLTPAREAFSVLEKHVRGKFGGMMDAQSKTFDGMMSNLSDWVGNATRTLAAPIFDKLKGGLEQVLVFLNDPKTQEGLTNFATALADGIGMAIQFVSDMMPSIVAGFTLWWNTLQQVIAFLQPLTDAVGLFITNLQEGRDPIEAIGHLLENVGTAVSDMTGQVLQAIGDALPGIWAKLVEWGKAFIDWIGPRIPPMLAELGRLSGELLNWVVNTALPTLVQKLGEWGAALWKWVSPMIGPALVELGKLLLQIGGWILTVALPAIITKLAEWGGAFLGWIGKDVLPFIGEKLGELWDALVKWIDKTVTDIFTEVKRIGDSIVQGIQKGVSDAWDAFVQFFKDLFAKLPDWLQKFIKGGSPALVFVPIGESITQGIAKGITDSWGNVTGALAGGMASTLAGGIGIPGSGSAGSFTGSRAGGFSGGIAGGGGTQVIQLVVDGRVLSQVMAGRVNSRAHIPNSTVIG